MGNWQIKYGTVCASRAEIYEQTILIASKEKKL